MYNPLESEDMSEVYRVERCYRSSYYGEVTNVIYLAADEMDALRKYEREQRRIQINDTINALKMVGRGITDGQVRLFMDHNSGNYLLMDIAGERGTFYGACNIANSKFSFNEDKVDAFYDAARFLIEKLNDELERLPKMTLSEIYPERYPTPITLVSISSSVAHTLRSMLK